MWMALCARFASAKLARGIVHRLRTAALFAEGKDTIAVGSNSDHGVPKTKRVFCVVVAAAVSNHVSSHYYRLSFELMLLDLM